MKTILRFLIPVFCLFVFMGVSAQNNQVLYFMKLPQNHLLNPAFKPSNTLYIGLPGITGVGVNISNNFISFSELFARGTKISKTTLPFIEPGFDRDRFLSRIKNLNYVEPQVAVQLLGFGIAVNKDLYLFLDINERADANVVLPRDLIRIAFLGNDEFMGKSFDLSASRLDFNAYNEIGFGASKNITPKLRIGAKAKLLFGITAGSFRSNRIDLLVSNNYTLNTDMTLDMSGPVVFEYDQNNKVTNAKFDKDGGIKDFVGRMKNAGAGLDIGAVYEINRNIVVSASVTDLGFIRWKADISNLKAKNNIELAGLDLTDVYDGNSTIDDVIGSIADTLKNSFYGSTVGKPFTTGLPFGVSVGGQYIFNDIFSAGLLSYSRIQGKQVKEAFTLSGNMNLGSVFSGTLAYTLCNSSYDNFGIGLAARGGPAQFYFLLDKIPFRWRSGGESGDKIVLPADWNTIHTRFGINLVFGYRKARPPKDVKDNEL
ncbi:MAG: DUF5723 family protein [Bacteroidota bacterium]|nr:DUF5723 family protein [Bacteroidota bacterium]